MKSTAIASYLHAHFYRASTAWPATPNAKCRLTVPAWTKMVLRFHFMANLRIPIYIVWMHGIWWNLSKLAACLVSAVSAGLNLSLLVMQYHTCTLSWIGRILSGFCPRDSTAHVANSNIWTFIARLHVQGDNKLLDCLWALHEVIFQWFKYHFMWLLYALLGEWQSGCPAMSLPRGVLRLTNMIYIQSCERGQIFYRPHNPWRGGGTLHRDVAVVQCFSPLFFWHGFGASNYRAP